MDLTMPEPAHVRRIRFTADARVDCAPKANVTIVLNGNRSTVEIRPFRGRSAEVLPLREAIEILYERAIKNRHAVFHH